MEAGILVPVPGQWATRKVRLLLDRGADMHVMNDDGQTPYQLYLKAEYGKIAELLWEYGADEA
jgi:ankyrin repeat protein